MNNAIILTVAAAVVLAVGAVNVSRYRKDHSRNHAMAATAFFIGGGWIALGALRAWTE